MQFTVIYFLEPLGVLSFLECLHTIHFNGVLMAFLCLFEIANFYDTRRMHNSNAAHGEDCFHRELHFLTSNGFLPPQTRCPPVIPARAYRVQEMRGNAA